jgi:hypothetical protein
MFNPVIILFFTLNLTISLKTTDFCILNQQECKGFYDRKENYYTKCDLIKCHDNEYRHQCELNICSRNKCDEYKHKQSITFKNLLFLRQPITPILVSSVSKEKYKIKLFKENIKYCKNKIYKFDSNDFCVNGRNCKTIQLGYGYNQKTKKVDCKCPSKQSFKCGKYCTTDSNACDYFNKKHKNLANIDDCGNQNTTSFSSNFIIW